MKEKQPPRFELWTLHEKIGKRRRWEPGYFHILFGPTAERDSKAMAKYLSRTMPSRTYQAVRYVPYWGIR